MDITTLTLRAPSGSGQRARTLIGSQTDTTTGLCPGHTVVVTAEFSATLSRVGA